MKRYIKNIFSHPLFSGSVLLVGGNMIVNGINYFYHIVMGKWLLSPSDYGTLASLYSILYLVSIVPTSTSVAIVKFISSSKDKSEVLVIYKKINKLILYIAAALFLIISLSSPFIAKFLNIKNFLSVTLVAPILFLSLLTLVNQATSQGLLKFIGLVIPNFISAVIKLVVGVFLIFLGWSVFGAMWGILVAGLLAYLYSFYFLKKLLPVKETKSSFSIKNFLKYASPVLFQALAFTSLFTIDVILVKHFFSPYQAGLYAAVATLGKIIFYATSPVSSAMFPIIVKRKSENKDYFKIFLTSLLVTGLISLSILIFYYLFPNIAIGVLFGKAYMEVEKELAWMGSFLFVYSLCFIVVNFFLSIGKTRVIIFPILAAIVQAIILFVLHGSLLQVIQVSLIITIFLFLSLLTFLGYNQLTKNYAEH